MEKLQARNDQTGFNFPTGIAVMAPTGVTFGTRTCQGKEDDFERGCNEQMPRDKH